MADNPTALILPWDLGKRVGPVVVCEQFGVAPPRGNRPQRSFRVATGQMILQFRLESHFRSPMPLRSCNTRQVGAVMGNKAQQMFAEQR